MQERIVLDTLSRQDDQGCRKELSWTHSVDKMTKYMQERIVLDTFSRQDDQGCRKELSWTHSVDKMTKYMQERIVLDTVSRQDGQGCRKELSWTQLVDKMAKDAGKWLGLLKSLPHLNPNKRTMIYKNMVISKMEYISSICKLSKL